MKKKVFFLLAFCLCILLIPVSAYAFDADHRSVEVSDLDELIAAIDLYAQECRDFNEAHQDEEDAWIGYVAEFHLAESTDLVIPEDTHLETLGTLYVPESCTVFLESGVVFNTGMVNYGYVCVQSGAELQTTMGGPDAILNHGSIDVQQGGVLRSMYGGHVHNDGAGAIIALNGVFYCGGYHDNGDDPNDPHEPRNVIWFGNTDGAMVEGSGIAVAGTIVGFGDTDSAAARQIDATQQLISALDCDEVFVYTAAEDFDTLKALNEAEEVKGIFIPEGEEEHRMVRVSEDLTIDKNLWIDNDCDLVVENGRTLEVDSFDHLWFSRHGRIVVEAEGAMGPGAPAGGTLIVEDTKYLSGSDESAIVRPTNDISWLSGASYLNEDEYPAKALWLYVANDAEASGTIPDSPNLDPDINLIVEGVAQLTVTGPLEVIYMEQRGVIVNPENITAQDVWYANDSIGIVNCTGRIFYEVAFDLTVGGWWESVYADADQTRIYLEDYDIDPQPTAEGHTFVGWEVRSGWDSVTPEQLAAFAVKTDDDPGSEHSGE
jgi:hypothetical protein